MHESEIIVRVRETEDGIEVTQALAPEDVFRRVEEAPAFESVEDSIRGTLEMQWAPAPTFLAETQGEACTALFGLLTQERERTEDESARSSSASMGSEAGQTMAEYGVILAVVCILTVGAVTLLAGGITNAINAVTGVLPG